MSSSRDQELEYHASQLHEIRQLAAAIINISDSARDGIELARYRKALGNGLRAQSLDLEYMANGYSTGILYHKLLRGLCQELCPNSWEKCDHSSHKRPEDGLPKIKAADVRAILKVDDELLNSALRNCVVRLFRTWKDEIFSSKPSIQGPSTLSASTTTVSNNKEHTSDQEAVEELRQRMANVESLLGIRRPSDIPSSTLTPDTTVRAVEGGDEVENIRQSRKRPRRAM